jgi:hypothetical protein
MVISVSSARDDTPSTRCAAQSADVMIRITTAASISERADSIRVDARASRAPR